MSNGANSIISMMYFFELYGLGESFIHFHVDNCVNRFMMYYLMWRVLTGQQEKVKTSFLTVRHTKFAPNWCFGMMKQQFY